MGLAIFISIIIVLLVLRKIFLSFFDFDFSIDLERKKRKVKIFDTDPHNKVIYLHNKSKNGVYSKPSSDLIDHVNYVESKSKNVLILLPHDANSILPKFYQCLFQDSIDKLGEVEFRKKFKFKSTNNYKFEKNLNEGIIRSIRK